VINVFLFKFKIFVLMLTSFALSGCSVREPVPVDLEFGLKSYFSIVEAKSLVDKLGGDWEIVERNELSEPDARAGYEYLRFMTSVFSDGSYTGKAVLSFFNGKLVSVWFYPDDWDSYKEYLAEKRGVELKNDTWENTSGNARSWIKTDHLMLHYVAWEDVVLADSMKRWLDKHS
jgi:hypothetical protein